MSGGQNDLRTMALLSVQRALWGKVTPDLRAVAVSWGPRSIRARFVYEHDITDDLRELVSEAETEVIADAPEDVSVKFSDEVRPVSSPLRTASNEWWAYLRRE
jgi:hypothetical protein